MFYKSSILAAIFVLLSVGNAIAADLSDIENLITNQQSELIVNTPNFKLNSTPKNSASIAKARLLKVAATETTTTPELNVSTGENSASIAKARLSNIIAQESSTPKSLSTAQPIALGATCGHVCSEATLEPCLALDPCVAGREDIANNSIKNQIKNNAHTISSSVPPSIQISNNTPSPNNFIDQNTTNADGNALSQLPEQQNIASATTELNNIKQWQINKSVTLNNVLSAPNPVLTTAQAPERLPDIPNSPTSTIETAKPIIPNLPTRIIETPQPTITTPIIGNQKPTDIKPSTSITETQKPEPQNNEPKKWAVGVHTQLSSTGFVGVDAGYKFSPNLHARLGLNTVGFNVDYTSQGIDYKAKFTPTNVHLLGDFFPFGGGLRLTGGLVFQSNQFNATGTPNSSAIPGGIPTQINLGGTDFNISDVGTVSSEGSFSNSVAPYLGIGFGTPLSPGLGFNFDAGVMFAGSANVKLRANIPSTVPAALQTQIRNSLAEQERRTNSDISSFNVYPVVSVGISYAF